MGESLGQAAASSNFRTPKSRSKKFRTGSERKLFRVLAKHRYPRKTAAHLRKLTYDPTSTIYDWLAGRSDAPFDVYIALLRGE